MKKGPTVSQTAGQLIAHYRAEWVDGFDRLHEQLKAGTISEHTYYRRLSVLEKRYGEAIDEQRARLWDKEQEGYE